MKTENSSLTALPWPMIQFVLPPLNSLKSRYPYAFPNVLHPESPSVQRLPVTSPRIQSLVASGTKRTRGLRRQTSAYGGKENSQRTRVSTAAYDPKRTWIQLFFSNTGCAERCQVSCT